MRKTKATKKTVKGRKKTLRSLRAYIVDVDNELNKASQAYYDLGCAFERLTDHYQHLGGTLIIEPPKAAKS